MGNTYFQFKQFRIEQDKTAMKVCTDSCILGAYTKTESSQSILDIGTGTGLLSLMLAQKSSASIDAIEIESNAFEQASINFSNSPWKERLHLHHCSIQQFQLQHQHLYDLIITNPPFFSNQLKSPDTKKNLAHHSEALTVTELLDSIQKLLNPNHGKCFILLPEFEFNNFLKAAEEIALYPQEIVSVRDKKTAPVLRKIGCFAWQKTSIIHNELIIKNEEGRYTPSFEKLLKDYYLIF